MSTVSIPLSKDEEKVSSKNQQKGKNNITKTSDTNQSNSSFTFSNPDIAEKGSRITEQ